MIDLVKFSPFIYPALPEVSDMEFISHTRRACVDFCRNTFVWQVDLEPMDLHDKQNTYALAIPENAELVRVMRVVVGDDEYTAINDTVGMSFGYAPYYVSHIASKEIDLVKTPMSNVPAGLKVRVALMPSYAAMEVPEILFTRYAEAISYGALGNLCAMAGRPFSNFEMAKQYREDFRHAQDCAKSEAAHGFSRATFETQSAYF
ncbi:MAG: hypothetical protein WBI40_04275 [Methylococcaceae bacterium]